MSKAICLSVILCISSLAGTAFAQAEPTTVLAASRGMTVTYQDVLTEIAGMPEANRRAALSSPRTLATIANNLIVRRVLAAEAKRDGLENDPQLQARLQIQIDRVLSDTRLAAMDKQNEPSEAALEAHAREQYRVKPERFEVPPQTRASHILIDNKGPESLEKAKDLVKQLRAGADFAALAKEHSTDTGSGARGGDLGFFGPGRMVRPFEEGVNALKNPGDISDPVESQFGWHIIRLDERKPKSVRPFDEVKQTLMTEARTALLNQSRVLKVQDMQKDIDMKREAIEALAAANTPPALLATPPAGTPAAPAK